MTKVVIVAGGKGERLRPITDTIAKPMVTVGGKPVLELNVDLFKKYGFNDFIFALCYLPETISNYFGDGSKFGVEIDYTYEDLDVPLGTAGAITLAKEKIKSTFVVTYGDSIRVIDFGEMYKKHKESGAFASLCVYKRFGADPKSSVIFDEAGRITEFEERPAPEEIKDNFVWANAALYIFEKEVLNYIENGKTVDFGKDIFPKLLEDGKLLQAFPMDGYFVDIGNKEKLDKANEDFKKGLIQI